MTKDFIRREDAVDAIREKFFTMSMCVSVDECKGMRYAQDLCAKTVERLPAADVREVVRGKWLDDPTNSKRKVCNRCGILHLIAQYPHGNINYCPNCGADMREVDDG